MSATNLPNELWLSIFRQSHPHDLWNNIRCVDRRFRDCVEYICRSELISKLELRLYVCVRSFSFLGQIPTSVTLPFRLESISTTKDGVDKARFVLSGDESREERRKALMKLRTSPSPGTLIWSVCLPSANERTYFRGALLKDFSEWSFNEEANNSSNSIDLEWRKLLLAYLRETKPSE